MKTIITASIASLFFSSIAAAFTIGTQNLYHYTTQYPERFANMDKEVAGPGVPQIICFQEAARWTSKDALYDHFINLTKYQGVYQSTNQLGVMNDGIALVSALPGAHFASAELPATKIFSRQFINSGVFQTEVGAIFVLNVHLSPFAENQDRRLIQAQFILDYIKQNSGGYPTLILGDLNDRYDSVVLKVFKDAGFFDVANGQGFTFNPDTNPLVKDSDKKFGPSRLDYILFQPARLKVKSTRLMFQENWVSDHYGFRAELGL